MAERAALSATDFAFVQGRVLDIVRDLAAEVGGDRARRAVGPDASLERQVGLGSLERVELLVRLEAAFDRALDDAHLQLDTPAELARALLGTGGAEPPSRDRAPVTGAATELGPAVATIPESLWRRAHAEPDRPNVFLREDEGAEQTVTYGRLWKEAAAVAGGLRERGMVKGDRVALMLPTGMDFLRSFQGILVGGGIPVPIYPPVRLDRLEEYARRQSAILADAGVRILVTVPRALPIAALLRRTVPTLAQVTTADQLVALGASWGEPRGVASDPAFIQYTSGSTGSPKGVLLTHANLLANIRAIGRGLEARPTDVGVSWLPLYHDMGLIGSWLFCLHQGLPIAILSPLAFLARPERWLWTIHERRATLSPAPNFAYELCVRKVPDTALEGLDLSSWRCALNGAEPVSPATLDRFCRRFAPYGFRREALMPVYGLAESSVALCVPPVGRGPKLDVVRREPFERDGRAETASAADGSALTFVSVGNVLPEHEVRIVDDAGADLPERTVGRLVFRGPSTTPGYFHKPEATEAISLPGGWLDSGDLAYQAEGELYVTGRRKDLIIKAGRNLVPQEIEEVASSVPGIRKGCVVAFGVNQEAAGTEILVVVAETKETRPEERDRLVAAVVERVASAVDLPPDVVQLVPPGSVPKTSSGKIRRAATREAYLVGELGRLPRTPLRRRAALVLAAAVEEVRPALARAGRWLYAIYLGIVAPLVVLPCWLLALLVPSRRLAFRLGRFTVKGALRLAGCRLSVTGLENLRGHSGPVILTSNHASYADVPALMALVPLDFVFLAKREALSYFVVGTYLRRAGHLTVDRFDVQQSLADAASIARALGAGDPVLIFPEATFTAAAGLRPFRLGAFKTAVETGAPIVPMTLRGTRRVMRGDWGIPSPGPIHLWIGPALFPQGKDWSSVLALRDRVYETILAHCGEPRLDIVVGGPERP